MKLDYKEARGWLTLPERDVLYERAREVQAPQVIVNIGVEYGASVICLEEGVTRPGIPIVGVDIDISKWQGGPLDGRNIHFVKADSGELAPDWVTVSAERDIYWRIGLLFIDGDHSYDGVVRDLEWVQYVAPGGYVLFHDCYEWPKDGVAGTARQLCPGVNQAVEEWANKVTVEKSWKELPYVDSIRIFQKLVW